MGWPLNLFYCRLAISIDSFCCIHWGAARSNSWFILIFWLKMTETVQVKRKTSRKIFIHGVIKIILVGSQFAGLIQFSYCTKTDRLLVTTQHGIQLICWSVFYSCMIGYDLCCGQSVSVAGNQSTLFNTGIGVITIASYIISFCCILLTFITRKQIGAIIRLCAMIEKDVSGEVYCHCILETIQFSIISLFFGNFRWLTTASFSNRKNSFFAIELWWPPVFHCCHWLVRTSPGTPFIILAPQYSRNLYLSEPLIILMLHSPWTLLSTIYFMATHIPSLHL